MVVTLSGCSGSFVVDIPADDDGPVCEATTGNCDEFDFNGCETDLATSMEHCGACGITCAAGDRCRDGRYNYKAHIYKCSLVNFIYGFLYTGMKVDIEKKA